MTYQDKTIELPLVDLGVVLAEASSASEILPEGHDQDPFNRTALAWLREVIVIPITDLPYEVATTALGVLHEALFRGDISAEEAAELTGEPVENFHALLAEETALAVFANSDEPDAAV